MYIKDDIVYADDNSNPLGIIQARFLDNYEIIVIFNNFKEKIINLKPILKFKCYEKLKDLKVFKSGYVDNGVLTWLNGEIDISTENLYYLWG